MTKLIRMEGVSWSEPPSRRRFRRPFRRWKAVTCCFLPDLGFNVEAQEALLFYALPFSARREERELRSGLRKARWNHREPAGMPRRSAASCTVTVSQPRRWSRGCVQPTATALTRRRASFRLPRSPDARRPGGRTTPGCTWTAFRRRPSGGRRILRVFSNVNPEDARGPGVVGDDFEAVARRFCAPVARAAAGRWPTCSRWVRVTRTPRSAYGRADAAAPRLHEGG